MLEVLDYDFNMFQCILPFLLLFNFGSYNTHSAVKLRSPPPEEVTFYCVVHDNLSLSIFPSPDDGLLKTLKRVAI
jgi:hypothetical protein